MTRRTSEPDTTSLLASQWHLTHIQLVNWGTFCGYQHLRLRDDEGNPSRVSMITGESGTGKSTLFDAKTAVLMRGTARFNIASNQTSGRARGSRERNLYSYVMGKQDDEYDPSTGEARESYLRSTASSNWSAIVLTFSCTTGETFCAARVYYVTAHATGNPDAWFLTSDNELDPRALSAHAQAKFNKGALRSAFPNVKIHDGQEAFLRAVYRRLGIGRDGEGDSAMKLQERIQAGTTITDVDALFKNLVIDEPSTYERAEEACASFHDHEAAWEEMDKARRKTADLEGIRETHEELENLLSEAEKIASCKPGEDGPLALWVERRGGEVLDGHARECDGRVSEFDGLIASQEREISDRNAELDRVQREVYGRGGDAIDRLRRDMEVETERLNNAREARNRLSDLLADVGRIMPGDAGEFDSLSEEAEGLLATFDEDKRSIEDARLTDAMRERELADAKKRLASQLKFYEANPVNISERMVEDRRRISEATGIPADQLPYAAELMDLREGEEEWRVAANVGFHGLATLMLVDVSRLEEFSVRVNSLRLNHRVTFQGVRPRAFRRTRPDAGRLSSKLVFKEDSPFSAWVAEWVHDSAHDYQCVSRPEDLGGRGQRITREGQTRQRAKGAHGHSKGSLIIGFTNGSRLAEIREELASTRSELEKVRARLGQADSRLRSLERRRDAALHIAPLRWEAIDTDSHQRRLDEMNAEVERLEKDESLAKLISRRDALSRRVGELTQELGALKNNRESESLVAHAAHEAASKAATKAAALVERGISVSNEQAELIAEFAARAEEPYQDDAQSLRSLANKYDDGTLRDAIARSMRNRMRASYERAEERTKALEKTFSNYKDRWLDFDDPTGTSVQSYPDYLRILEELEAEQMDLHIDDWLVETLRQTGAALAPLSRAYTNDLRNIHRRMEPINAIMSRFKFGPNEGELTIKVTDRTPKGMRDFRQELAGWAQLATQGDFDDADRLHHRLRTFMSRLEEASKQGERGPLNTKRLVYIKVIARYPDKPEIPDKSFESIAAKSGGENQELIAFILGAALLFCLGDNGQSLPTFAPVFLDEAFIKADERFTRRAIEALVGLGFQVIIAVPTSKVQAVEPVADEYVCITKNPSNNHSFISEMTGVRPDA